MNINRRGSSYLKASFEGERISNGDRANRLCMDKNPFNILNQDQRSNYLDALKDLRCD